MELNRKAGLAVLTVLFLFAPFYYQPNIGKEGLHLPFNITVWGAALTVIVGGGVCAIVKRRVFYNIHACALFIFPVLISIYMIFAEQGMVNVFVIKTIYILGGCMFLVALFQYDLNKNDIDVVLLMLSISMILHAGIGVLQLSDMGELSQYISRNDINKPAGVFQQINNQASYLSTGVLINFYIISDKKVSRVSLFIIVVSVFLSALIVANSGSRVGMLSLLLGYIILLIARFQGFWANKKVFGILMVAFILALFLGFSGVGEVIKKSQGIVGSEYSDVRSVIYKISFEIIKSSPVWGHGIGGFINAWYDIAPDFYLQNNDVKHVPFITHPHNEILIWVIETGVVGVLGGVIISWIIINGLIKNRFKAGLSMLGVLVPIILHTQVELPFYLSSLHWLLFVFLLYIVFKGVGVHFVNINDVSYRYIFLSIPLLYIFGMYFLYHSEISRREIYKFVNKDFDNSTLDKSLVNYYFQPDAERLLMNVLFYSGMKHQDKMNIQMYIGWAEEYIKYMPDENIYEELSQAYEVMGQEKEKCQLLLQGVRRYPENIQLNTYFDSCS